MERKILAVIFLVIFSFTVIFSTEIFVFAESSIVSANNPVEFEYPSDVCNESKSLKMPFDNRISEKKDELFSNIDKSINIEFLKANSCKNITLYDYLIMVVMSEMPYTYETEALKAQAVAARTYTLRLMEDNDRHNGFSVCNNANHCSAALEREDYVEKYGDKAYDSAYSAAKKAVSETDGLVIKFDGELCCAVYHSNSNGKTESSYNLWGTYTPYLVSVSTSESATRQSVNVNKEKFIKAIGADSDNISIIYNDSGRVKEIKCGNISVTASKLREIFSLKSCDFDIFSHQNEIIFEVYGYGHGIGMSQLGANEMAKEGSAYTEILKHYYSGVVIEAYKKPSVNDGFLLLN